jgi:hypothetical protein
MSGVLLAPHNERVDLDLGAFLRDGYVAIRGAFDAGTASACRQAIWKVMSEQGIHIDEPATWPHRSAGPRMIAQPAIQVRDGFILGKSDPSPVARAIVTGLAMAH